MTASRSKRKARISSADRPTMRDVARLAGDVHPSTVSLALRNNPRISPEMRATVQAAANQVGYRRDPLLDAFNQHRLKSVPHRASRHIAAISDFSSAGELARSPHHAAARAGAMEAAARLHCHLDFFFCGPGQPSPRRLDAVLAARGLRALLLFGVRENLGPTDFTWSRTCTVAIDSLQMSTPLYRVTPDYREATRLLWRQARAQGHRRIGIIRSNASPLIEDRAIAGFLLEEFRHPEATAIPIFTLAGERGARPRFHAWLQAHGPTVIIHPSIAGKFLAQLLARKKIPCLAFDALSADAPGIFPDYAEVGRRAVEQLITLMQTNQRGLPPTAVCTYVPVQLPA